MYMSAYVMLVPSASAWLVPIDEMLHHNQMLWMSTASLGFVRCERNPHEPQDGFVQTLLSRVDLKGARRLMTAWDKNVNFVELLKEDSLLEIETDIFTFSENCSVKQFQWHAMIEIEIKFSNKSELINVDKNSVWVVPDGIGSI